MSVLLPAVLAGMAAGVAVRGSDATQRLHRTVQAGPAGSGADPGRPSSVLGAGAPGGPGALGAAPGSTPARDGVPTWAPARRRAGPGGPGRTAAVCGAPGPGSVARPVSAGGEPPAHGLRSRLRGPPAACALLGVALAVLLGDALGIGLGLAVVLGGPRLLDRLEPRAERQARVRFATDLPGALDLLAACLAGGAALPAAVGGVADAVPGPCGQRLGRVAAALAVGAAPADAWAELAVGDADGLAASAARALARAAEGGAPVAATVARLADDARAERRSLGEQAAARAGVQAVGPLALCFLPAFVLVGVVPVIAGLVGPLLAGF